jgi:hypothetical protein
MRLIEDLCPPAFLFLIYIVVHIALDISLGMYTTAGIKVVAGAVQIFLLNAFCKFDLGVVSWVIISLPFLMTALATSIAMGLQMDKAASKYLKESFTTTGGQADGIPEQANSI